MKYFIFLLFLLLADLGHTQTRNGRDSADAFYPICTTTTCCTAPPPQVPDSSMVLVRGGTFMMGCTNEQVNCRDHEKPAHQVTLPDFHIGQYEVTRQFWREVMGSDPPELVNEDCDRCPVQYVSWDDVQVFLQKLNARYPGRNYRLPTEAEWEYAAREGGKAMFFGNGQKSTQEVVSYYVMAEEFFHSGLYFPFKTYPVGSINTPNALGLHNMSDNVWEWCSDWYSQDYYQNSPENSPQGPVSGLSHVIRGGEHRHELPDSRVSERLHGRQIPPQYIGFRLARTP